MKTLTSLLALLVLTELAAAGPCVLRIGGKTVDAKTHAIVMPDKPTPQETRAAADLRAQLHRLTGHDLPVAADSKAAKEATPIVVGKSAAALKTLGVAVDFDKLGLEGIVIKTKGPALILAGNRRGVLYAVFTFLEDYCHCRWFTPDCTVIPADRTFEIKDLDVRYVPPLEYRSTDYPVSRPADWAVRNKINGTQTSLDEARGGKIAYAHFVHTFNSILNPAQHFAKHPEYFSMIKGKRVGGRTQLCLTNPQVIAIAKKAVRQWIREHPAATIFSVSQNDWHNYCTCPPCAALAKKEGSQSGPMIHFVNAIADDIAKDHPDKLISTLAYQYTRKPPLHVRPRPNVTVRLCSIECCFAHPLDECPTNRSFVADIKGWSRICKRLSIWDYVINYAHSVQPFPNLYSLAPNIRFFTRNGVTSIYEEACYFTPGSELAELRTWIMAKTLWDPGYDTDRAIDEFLSAYYGPAGPFIRQYVNLIHKQVAEHKDWHVNIWSRPTVPHIRPEVIQRAVKLFDQAERVVSTAPVLLHRVRAARMPIQYVQIVTARRGLHETDTALAVTADDRIRGMIDRFERTARKAGLKMVREHYGYGNLDKWLATVRRTEKPVPIVRLAGEGLELVVVPSVGGRIWKMVHKPSGREILKRYHTSEGSAVPNEGGYEEYSTDEYRSPGWAEPYRVTAKSATSVTLSAQLPGGLRLDRKIQLDAKKAVVWIQSTLTNTGKQSTWACLRAHPEFSVTDVQKAFVLVARKGKAPGRIPTAIKDDVEEQRDQWLRGDEMPAGEWTLVDPGAKLSIICRFDVKHVDQCLLSRSIPQARVNLEYYSPSKTLKPGESTRLEHAIEVRTWSPPKTP